MDEIKCSEEKCFERSTSRCNLCMLVYCEPDAIAHVSSKFKELLGANYG